MRLRLEWHCEPTVYDVEQLVDYVATTRPIASHHLTAVRLALLTQILDVLPYLETEAERLAWESSPAISQRVDRLRDGWGSRSCT